MRHLGEKHLLNDYIEMSLLQVYSILQVYFTGNNNNNNTFNLYIAFFCTQSHFTYNKII